MYKKFYIFFAVFLYGYSGLLANLGPGTNAHGEFFYRQNSQFNSTNLYLNIMTTPLSTNINKCMDIGGGSFPDLLVSYQTDKSKKKLKIKSNIFNCDRALFIEEGDPVFYYRVTAQALTFDYTGECNYFNKWINGGYEWGIKTKGCNHLSFSAGPYLSYSTIKLDSYYFGELGDYTQHSFSGFDVKLNANTTLSTYYFYFDNMTNYEAVFGGQTLNLLAADSRLAISLTRLFGNYPKWKEYHNGGFMIFLAHSYKEYFISSKKDIFNTFGIGISFRGY